MIILCCFGQGEPEFSTAKGLVYAFRLLGHNVITCGPSYWGRGEDCDISVPDKPFPETYEYSDILRRVSGQVDLVLQCEPHFFLVGKKPPEVNSCYYFTDPHRGGEAWYRMAVQGNFNNLFIGQPYFAPLYRDIPNTRVHILPPAFDERRFMKGLYTAPKVDLSFVGESGIANMEYPFEDEIGRFATKPPANLPTDTGRYAFPSPGFDYCERAEILIRLCHDFDVRMYDQVWEPLKFQKAIQGGVIGFNRSLLNDISIRAFETMAGGRLLMTDDPNGWFFEKGFRCPTYQNYFKPFFPNFDLDYKNIHNKVKRALNNDSVREDIAEHDFNLVWEKHTWRCRANQILSTVFN